MNVIEINGVSKWFGKYQALDECTVHVAKGEVVVVCGPSGSGKSTLIKTINGLESFQEGDISVDGTHIHRGAKIDFPKLRARVGMVFQQFELFPHLTVTENITLGPIRSLSRGKAAAREKAHVLLQRVGLLDQKDKYPAQLSGGQQQRVAIARALAMDPIVMLFDEPTSALDPEMVTEVLDVMTDLANDGMTMIVVTHEMGFAKRVADRVVFVDVGKVVEDCSTSKFFSDSEQTSERVKYFLSKILSH